MVVLLACSQSGRLPPELSLAGKRARELWDGQVLMSDHEPGDLHWEHLHTAFLLLIKEQCAFFLVTECIIQEWHFLLSPSVGSSHASDPGCKCTAIWVQTHRRENGFVLCGHSFLTFALPLLRLVVQLTSLNGK